MMQIQDQFNNLPGWHSWNVPRDASFIVNSPPPKDFGEQCRNTIVLSVGNKSSLVVDHDVTESQPKNKFHMFSSLTNKILQSDEFKTLEEKECNVSENQNSPSTSNETLSKPTIKDTFFQWLPTEQHKITLVTSLPDLHKLFPVQRDESRRPSPKSTNNNTRKLKKPSWHNRINEVDFHSLVPRITNVTATVNLKCKIDLNKVKLLPNTIYEPECFVAVTMKIRDPRSTALIFSCGKIVCTGCDSIESTRTACRRYARLIQKTGCNVKFRNFKIQNLVVGYYLPYHIDLQSLMGTIEATGSSYVPEVFPGLKYQTKHGKICAKVFITGTVYLTGAKNLEEAQQVFEEIYPNIEAHRRDYSPPNSNQPKFKDLASFIET